MRFAVYASSLGNCFFEEVRDLLACGLQDLGFKAETADETGGFRKKADWHLVVAPHEFFLAGKGLRLLRAALPERLVFYSGEQRGCKWFSLAETLFGQAREIWHVERQAAELIAKRGFASRHVPLGYSPRHRRFKAAAPLAERPVDVFFAGSLTERRRRFFKRQEPSFSRRRTSFHFADPKIPMRPERRGILGGAELARLSGRSKVVLNLHRGPGIFFEWHRIALHGLGQGALVLSEPVSPDPLIKAGRDFAAVRLGDMGEALEYYLSDTRGRRRAQEIADRGFETFSRHCRMSEFLGPAVEGLLRPKVARRPDRRVANALSLLWEGA